MKIEKESEEQIINLGALGYDARKMCNILNVEENEIENEMKDEVSDFSKLYKKGQDMSDYVIDLKLFEMAKSGDIKALDKLELRKRIRKDESIKRMQEETLRKRLKEARENRG